jgi:hypothetical protein
MKQTAVEFLEQELDKNFEIKGNSFLFDKILKQAKLMEKEQIIDAHCDWARLTDNLPTRTAVDYYNQTFKSE